MGSEVQSIDKVSLVVASAQNPEGTAPLGLQEVGVPASWGWRPRLHAAVPPGLCVDAEPRIPGFGFSPLC